MQFFLKHKYQLTTITLLMLVFSSCLSTHNLSEGEFLYTGANVIINDNQPIENRDQIVADVSEVITPKPNDKLMWIVPIKLWIYNITGVPKSEQIKGSWTDSLNKLISPEEEKGLGPWIKRKMGQAPVKRSQVYPLKIIPLMENRMKNLGYFKAKITFENDTAKWNKRKVTILYKVQTDSAYTIDKYVLPDTSTVIGKAIYDLKENSLIKVGQNFDYKKFVAERERIDITLKEKGYYFFNPDLLVFKVDSTLGNKLQVSLSVKPNVPVSAVRPYSINNIYIYQDFSLERNKMLLDKVDTVFIRGCYYLRNQRFVSPSLVVKSLFLRKNDIYSSASYSQSMKYVAQLGVFKYMKIEFARHDTVGADLLDMKVYLTPMKKKSINIALNYLTRSTNFTGPGFILSFNNRNLLGKAEKFTFKIDGGLESQYTGVSTGYLGKTSYELGVGADLVLPRFFPFKSEKQARRYIPKTKFSIDYRYLYQVRYYKMSTSNFTYGYMWQETEDKTHQLNLFSISYQHLADSTSAFHNKLVETPLLQRGYEDQFILGSIYSFTYSNLKGNYKNSGVYFNANLELSGNILYGIQKYSKVEKTPYKLFNTRYAQFVKIGSDYRKYVLLSPTSVFISRLFAGVGLPMGNSSVLPYMKQYFSGGANSIRAFPARSIGPGRFKAVTDNASLLIDKTGDLKLEANLEYRLRFWTTAELALFVDAGNVWLFNDDAERPGAKFLPNEFYKDIAIGAGFGFRYDADFFVVRFDLGFPIRQSLYSNVALKSISTWVSDKSVIWKNDWKPTVNIAIGYPF